MKADDNRDQTARALTTLGIIILIVGLVVAILQILNISNDVNSGYQLELLGILCWIAVGMAIEFFGIGLIIIGKEK